MKNRLRLLLSITLITTALSGCATTDSGKTKTQGTVFGAGIGAGLGALLGAAVGGKEGAAKGALLGGALGAAGGFAYGNHVAGKKEKFANQEDYLNAVIAEAEKVNQETRQYNVSLRRDINKLEDETRHVKLAVSRGHANRSVLRKQIQKIEQEEIEAKEQLAKINRELGVQQQVLAESEKERGSSQQQLQQIQQEIALLEENKRELEGNVESLASLRAQA